MVPWYPVSLFTFIRGINWVKSQRRVLWQVVESATFEPIYAWKRRGQTSNIHLAKKFPL